MLDFLREEHIDKGIIEGIMEFRQKYGQAEAYSQRAPRYVYYGKEVWEQAARALLCGKNLLLAGAKATGKNMLAENLAEVFGRPSWNVSFHINMDASYMIGTDTFREGQVVFRPGPVYESAAQGGFCILDEINMARNEALAVLHSVLDFRRVINVPGYIRISVHEAARFIATMNYGYAGTRDLNEALTSRFMVIHAGDLPGQSGKTFKTGIPFYEKLLYPAVCRAVPGYRKEVQKRRTDQPGPGSEGTFRCLKPHGKGPFPSGSPGHGNYQQNL